MKLNYDGLYVMFLALIVFQSCTLLSTETSDLPGIEINPDNINTDFIIFEDPVGGSANTHKNNELLAVTVKNLVETQIEFSAGFVSLFAQTNNGWVKIDNLMDRPDTAVRLPTSKKFPPGMIVTVIPWIPDLKEPTTVRIFFEGQNVDTGDKVGAYTDFTLLP